MLWNTVVLFADIQIEITHGVDSAQPIAILPFTLSDINQLSSTSIDSISSIINSDLCSSGQFNAVPLACIPHQLTTINDIIPMFWEKLGVNVIVLGAINIDSNNKYNISYQLIDSSNNPALVILENQYSVQKQWLRYIAHTISNEIFEKLTGIKGIFCTRIAYVTYIKHNKYPYELYISDYDGYNKISICQSLEPIMSPAWSPDGKHIAYVTFSAGYSELVIQTLSTGIIQHIIHFAQHNGAPAFSPDGNKLAFSSSQTGSLNLYIMDLLSKEIQQLTNNNNNNTEPSWFPDNKNLAYTSDQSGMPQIYKINIDTHEMQRLSWLHTTNQSPHVSAHGNFIIMINRFQGQQKIAKLDLLKGTEKTLTNTFLDDTPSIAPNETVILYSTINKDSPISSNVQLISIDGTFTAYVPGITENIRFPTWSSCCTS